jgi:hypothetical protein
MVASQMPPDLPLPISIDHGDFVPASGQSPSQAGPDGIPLSGYDPWLWADTALMSDHSQPTSGPYGEATAAKSATIVAEWGGMPSPAIDYQQVDGAVLITRTRNRTANGPNGVYYGGQQTAWEAAYVDPVDDYWSVLTGSG